MLTTCVVCNAVNSGMISIFHHPNNLDLMLTFVSNHQVDPDDYLCITCYDELKIAFNFKQKCHQSKLYRSEVTVNAEAEQENDLSQQIEISSSSAVVKEERSYLTASEGQNSTQNDKISNLAPTPAAYNENEIEECIEDYFVNEKSDDNQENDHENSDDGKYIIQMIESDESSGIKENLEDEEDEEVDDSEEQKTSVNCEICDKIFTKTENYRRHMLQLHSASEKRERIPRDKHRRGPVPKYHENDLFKNLKETQCEFCYKIFDSLQLLHDHEEHHKKEDRPYRCNNSECSARFKDRYSVRSHISIHTGEKRYKCRYCEKRFHQSGNAKAHERYHTGEKPYLCPHCGKGFAENGNLKAHIRHHTGERPYECPYCTKTFRTHYSHKIHVRSHTQEKPFECADCGKSFNCTGKLKIHQRIHTGVRPFKCQVCSAAFMDSSRLKRHSKTHTDYSLFSEEREIDSANI